MPNLHSLGTIVDTQINGNVYIYTTRLRNYCISLLIIKSWSKYGQLADAYVPSQQDYGIILFYFLKFK